MAKCDLCGKRTVFGRNVSHSKRHTARLVHPNVHRARVVVGGAVKRLQACTRCLRTRTKATR